MFKSIIVISRKKLVSVFSETEAFLAKKIACYALNGRLSGKNEIFLAIFSKVFEIFEIWNPLQWN